MCIYICTCIYNYLNEQADELYDEVHINEQLNAINHKLNQIALEILLFCLSFSVTLNVCTWKYKGGDVCVHFQLLICCFAFTPPVEDF